MGKTFVDGFPIISNAKCEAAKRNIIAQDFIEGVRVSRKPFLEIVADSSEMLDPPGARVTMENALRNMGFGFGFTTHPTDGDNISYETRGGIYLARAVFAHGGPSDPGIGVSVRWERKLRREEYNDMTT